ncbi:hypothetical protein [Methylobacterium nodulans]|uniref:hypothetical protein n=1 Tax=Methylobacterium nodulans TaxID=114616 RepID=UPI0001618F2A|nr:hypothetical protein [Methylobacterium nodulans]
MQTHPIIVERLITLGWQVEPLGLPYPYDGKPLVPIYARWTPRTAAASLAAYELRGPALSHDEVVDERRREIVLPSHYAA